MAKVTLSVLADADLVEILIFGEQRFGTATADTYVRSFEGPFGLLARHPLIGSQAFEDDPDTHVLHHRRHRIFYEVGDEGVLILRILHHAVDVRRRMRRSGVD